MQHSYPVRQNNSLMVKESRGFASGYFIGAVPKCAMRAGKKLPEHVEMCRFM
ncbi:hypothetical protein ACL2XG_20530 [Sodalis sp. RH24]|uniref:hypothetical protein n=1 Tax=unclassified Sodalis (in: enterobacteria) TaxID=2636512 RepID=UPI0039659616